MWKTAASRQRRKHENRRISIADYRNQEMISED
jgi:hypothetical protein